MKTYSSTAAAEISTEGIVSPSQSSLSNSPIANNPDATRDTGRALFAVSSLGLGHATRTLVVIREYLRRGYAITVVSAGNALSFLRLELAGEPGVEFREMTDYPPLERGTGWRLYWYLFIDLLETWRLIRSEHREVQAIAADYDFIFSDGKYGFHSRWTPSFILSHQIAFVPPKGLRETSWLTESINVAALRKFDMLFIPDYFGPSLNLAGHLAHSRALHRCPHRYIGILSSYRHLDLEQDIDCLFVISGYLIEHKESFVRDLLEQAGSLPGKKVFVLGNAGGDESAYDRYRRDDLQIYAVASGDLRQELFNRARMIVSRAGYTTVMDLVEHDKRALLIPTPNQTEQEYLASYLGSQHYYVARTQQAGLDLGTGLAGLRTDAFVRAAVEDRRVAAPHHGRYRGIDAPALHIHHRAGLQRGGRDRGDPAVPARPALSGRSLRDRRGRERLDRCDAEHRQPDRPTGRWTDASVSSRSTRAACRMPRTWAWTTSRRNPNGWCSAMPTPGSDVISCSISILG